MNSTELPVPVRDFAMRFTSTARGARLARRLCGERLHAWGVPHGSDAHDVLTLIAAELCANAVRHGHVPGRDFHFRVTVTPPALVDDGATTVRIEVTDTRGERLPVRQQAPSPAEPSAPYRVGGRGLMLVEALADRWGWTPRADAPGKTVWAEYTVTRPKPDEEPGTPH